MILNEICTRCGCENSEILTIDIDEATKMENLCMPRWSCCSEIPRNSFHPDADLHPSIDSPGQGKAFDWPQQACSVVSPNSGKIPHGGPEILEGGNLHNGRHKSLFHFKTMCPGKWTLSTPTDSVLNT